MRQCQCGRGEGWRWGVGVKFVIKCYGRAVELVFTVFWRGHAGAWRAKPEAGAWSSSYAAGRVFRPSSPRRRPARPTYRPWAASWACRRRCPRPASGVRAGRQGPIRAPPSALQGASLPGADAAAGRRAGSGCAGLRGPCLARVAMELRQCGRRPAGCPGPGRGARGQGSHAIFGDPWPRNGHFPARGLGDHATPGPTPVRPPQRVLETRVTLKQLAGDSLLWWPRLRPALPTQNPSRTGQVFWCPIVRKDLLASGCGIGGQTNWSWAGKKGKSRAQEFSWYWRTFNTQLLSSFPIVWNAYTKS